MGLFGNKTSKSTGAHQWRGVIEEYRDRLPVSAKTPIVSLREGGTPLIYACYLSELLSNDVWIKFEGTNPTGSFKDRGIKRPKMVPRQLYVLQLETPRQVLRLMQLKPACDQLC